MSAPQVFLPIVLVEVPEFCLAGVAPEDLVSGWSLGAVALGGVSD